MGFEGRSEAGGGWGGASGAAILFLLFRMARWRGAAVGLAAAPPSPGPSFGSAFPGVRCVFSCVMKGDSFSCRTPASLKLEAARTQVQVGFSGFLFMSMASNSTLFFSAYICLPALQISSTSIGKKGKDFAETV